MTLFAFLVLSAAILTGMLLSDYLPCISKQPLDEEAPANETGAFLCPEEPK